MLHKTKNNCIFVVSHTARYDYAYSEVRGELVCRGAQTADQDCEVRRICRRETILRANILLAVDRNGKQPMTVQEAAIAFNTSATTVQNVRTCYGKKGLDDHSAKETGDAASRGQVYRRRRGSYHSSAPAEILPRDMPSGRFVFLPTRSVKLGYIKSISHTQVGRILKKRVQASSEEVLVHTSQP